MKRSPAWMILGWALFLATLVWAQPRGFGPFTGGGTGGLPSGAVYLIVTGTCPAGSTEVSALDGRMLQATIAANADVGTTGGLGTITPVGTVSQPTLSMSAYTPGGSNNAPTFSGSLGTIAAQTITWPGSFATFSGVTLATHTHNMSGAVLATHTHNMSGVALPTHTHSAGSFINLASATTGNCAATSIAAGTGLLTACKTTAPNLTVAAQSHSGSVALVSAGTPAGTNSSISAGTPAGTNSSISAGLPAGTIAWPVAVPTTGSVNFTPAGSVSAPIFTGSGTTLQGTVSQPSFTGSDFDPHPPFTKVIFCQVT